MSKYAELFDWLQSGCSQLSKLQRITGDKVGTADANSNIILPAGGSRRYSVSVKPDVTGEYEFTMTPSPARSEDYTLNAYAVAETDSTTGELNFNTLRLDEVQAITDWVIEQNNKRNLPIITGKTVLGIEVSEPQIKELGADSDLGLVIVYFLTLTVWYANEANRVDVLYEVDN